MIGAGFSKNAISKSSNSEGLPTWNELGDILYEKLHGEKPDGKSCYLNPLKLADEVQAAYGRTVLDQLLKKHIRDKDFEPSNTHIKLLELPWADVFTTNYDTLLERACENVIDRRYDVVINQEDLIYSNKPRIIKLHGSFPSERPLIITEEDYRKYPRQFAPLVNTVQQSLLENTLCLIGFSGDDPNFLQWIGWINDNIGKENSPKIYLVGILKITDAQKRLLASKNIVSVDLSGCLDIVDTYKKGIDFFIDFLLSQRKGRGNLDWPIKQNTYWLKEEKGINDLLIEWRLTRKSYPKWIIAPLEQRAKLWSFTEHFAFDTNIFEHLELWQDFEYSYELNWRLNKSLSPIFNAVAFCIKRVVERYNPFPNAIADLGEINYDESKGEGQNWKRIRRQWIELVLSLLRFFREEGFETEWNEFQNRLSNISKYLSPEEWAWLCYERIQKALFSLDTNGAKVILEEWPTTIPDPFWNAKRAALCAEFGQLEEAEKSLEVILTELRKQLNLSPVENDYSLVSQEAYIMFLLRQVSQHVSFKRNKFIENDETKQNFNERWNLLLQYKCDPWAEVQYFDLTLRNSYSPPHYKTRKNGFEIGRSTVTYSSGGINEDANRGYEFLRFLEETCYPLSLPYMGIDTKTIKGALERTLYSPKWALAVMTRCRDYELIDSVFNRLSLSKISVEEVDHYVSYYINKFNDLLPEIETSEFAKAIIKKTPGILWRLCVKCSEDAKTKIAEFYQIIFRKNMELPKTHDLFKILIFSSSHKFISKIVPLLLDTPILEEGSRTATINYVEPFDYLNGRYDIKPTIITKQIFRHLKEKITEEKFRKRAIRRILFLNKNNCLNKRQAKELFNSIWNRVDENSGFPDSTDIYNFVFVLCPHPKDIIPIDLFKTYIKTQTFNVQTKKAERGISMSGGEDLYATDLLYGSATFKNKTGIKWAQSELEDILYKAESWLASDRHFLTDEKYLDEHLGGSIREEFLSRFKNLVAILARVFGYQRETIRNKQTLLRIKKLILELETCGVPVLTAKIAFAELFFPNTHETYLCNVQRAMVCDNRSVVIDALDSIILAVTVSALSVKKNFKDQILEMLYQPLRWHVHNLLGDCMDAYSLLLQDKYVFFTTRNILVEYLTYLYDVTDYMNLVDYKIDFDQILFLKQKGVLISSKLYWKFQEEKLTIPHIVEKWKEVAFDPNEFGDIKNNWM